MEEDIKSSPINKKPNPVNISPICLFFASRANKTIPAPIPTRRGAKNSGFSISPHSLMETIQLVTVVPIFAPIIIPTACVRFIIPALTKPTTITVVADELCTIAVIPAPISTPKSRLEVNTPKSCCIRLPADFCRPSAMLFIPYKNIPRPPVN